MRYMIDGADRKTGQDVKIIVEAVNEKAAVAEAHKRGLLVAACVPESKGKQAVASGIAASSPNPVLSPFRSAALAGARTAEPSVKNGNRQGSQEPPAGNRVLRLAVIVIVTVAVTFGALYFMVLRPQKQQIHQTLESSIDQIEKTQASAKKNTAQRPADARPSARRETPQYPAQQPVPAESAASAQATAQLRQYVQSCEGFIREAKALRARVSAGISYSDFNEKLQDLIDEYAQIGRPPTQGVSAGFIEAGVTVMEQYHAAGKQWSFALRNNLYLAEKYQIREKLQAAGNAVDILVSHFEKMQSEAGR